LEGRSGQPEKARQAGSIRASLVICTIILLLAAAYLASSVFAPLTWFILAIVRPLQKTLEASLPKGVALFLTLSVPIIVVLVFASMVAWMK
jgi:predicted PurR-regulated permease PerM